MYHELFEEVRQRYSVVVGQDESVLDWDPVEWAVLLSIAQGNVVLEIRNNYMREWEASGIPDNSVLRSALLEQAILSLRLIEALDSGRVRGGV
jgi:hypothetical protein